MKLQKKVLTIILPVIAVFMTVFSAAIFYYLNTDYINKVHSNSLKNLNQTNIYLTSYQEQRVNEMHFISNIEEVKNYLDSTGSIKYTQSQNHLVALLESSLSENKNIEEYFIINNKRDFLFSYSRDLFYDDREDREKISKHFKDYRLKKGEVVISYEELSSGNRIVYIKKVSNKGYLVVAENMKFFEYYSNLKLEENSALFLLKDYKIVHHNTNQLDEVHLSNYKKIINQIPEQDLEKGYNQKEIDFNENSYFTYLILNKEGFQLFGMLSTKETESAIVGFIIGSIVFTVLLTLILGFTIYYSMNKIIIKPINLIEKESKLISKGKYDLMFNKKNKDEISSLSNTLSEVCINIVEKNEKIHKTAYFDDLTGLPNKRSFDIEAKEWFKKAKFNNEELAVMLIDLDDFKEINDTFGHEVGDEFLKTISSKFQKSIEKTILLNNYNVSFQVSRIAGDDFLVLLQGENLNKVAEDLSKNILNNISDKVFLDERSFFPSASIGISVYPHNSTTINQTYQFADMAMYKAKSSGKNKYVFINDEILNEKKEQEQLSKDIKEALINDDFYLNFQPKYNVKTGKYNQFEALIRWQHKEKGFVSPGKFIPFAEKSSLIVQIGDWVIYNVCKHIKTLEEMGWKDFKISLNVSYKQLQEDNFISNLKGNIEKHKINPNHLEIEITEHTIVKDLEQALTDLKSVRELGVSVSLDDFGTGYSSLIYLQSLPLDILKIDRAFVMNSTESEKSQGIIKTIITLAKGLGLKTVAEGVETKEEYELLKSFGCDYIQGFYFYKPLEFGKIIEIGNKKET